VYYWTDYRSRDILWCRKEKTRLLLMKTWISLFVFLKMWVSSVEDVMLSGLKMGGSRWVLLNARLAISLVETRLSWNQEVASGRFWTRASFAWNAKVALDHSGCGYRLKCGSPQCHALAQFELEICAMYLDSWEVYKRPESFNSQFTWLFIFNLNSRLSFFKAFKIFIEPEKPSNFSSIFIERAHHGHGPKR